MEIRWHDLTHPPPDWQDGALQQSLAYGAAMASLGARVRLAEVAGLGRAMVLHRGGLRLINRGPIFSPHATLRDRVQFLRSLARHAGLTVATFERHLGGFGLIPLITPRHHAIWDLRPLPHTLRAALLGKWRNRLKAVEGLEIRPAGPQARAVLIAAEARQRAARGYRALPATFLDHWPEDQMLALQWCDGQEVQAGMVFLRHGRAATYHLGWASAVGRAAFAHGPMLWQAALALRAQGVEALDLGAVDSANPGLARFKLGTGAALHALGATTLVVPG